jgi:hypothetical protein
MNRGISAFSVAELAAYVQEALRRVGIDVVLSGGNCVSIWSDNAYRSDDIDLVPDGLASRAKIRKVMNALGFVERNRYFVHPEHQQWVEFPSGPLGVGNERPKVIAVRQEATGSLRLLSPTDCIKDRLTWWYHGGDRQGLEQAVAVGRQQSIDIKELRRWSVNEGKAAEFEELLPRLTAHLKSIE